MKNFPKSRVRERTELAHSGRQGREASVPGEGRWAPLPPQGIPREVQAAQSSDVPSPQPRDQLAPRNRPWGPPGGSPRMLQEHFCFPKGSRVEGLFG